MLIFTRIVHETIEVFTAVIVRHRSTYVEDHVTENKVRAVRRFGQYDAVEHQGLVNMMGGSALLLNLLGFRWAFDVDLQQRACKSVRAKLIHPGCVPTELLL